MLLSDRDIRAELAAGRVSLAPYDAEMVQPSSVDVRLDRFFRVFENHLYPHIDPSVEQRVAALQQIQRTKASQGQEGEEVDRWPTVEAWQRHTKPHHGRGCNSKCIAHEGLVHNLWTNLWK